jgi:hypothetical protein
MSLAKHSDILKPSLARRYYKAISGSTLEHFNVLSDILKPSLARRYYKAISGSTLETFQRSQVSLEAIVTPDKPLKQEASGSFIWIDASNR